MRQKPLYDLPIAQLVARQLGHITRRQLLEHELTRAWVDHRIATGELIPVHAGVYAVGHVPHHAHCRAMAAVLACGDVAALSHAAALALWDAGEWPATLEVWAPSCRRRPGLRIHRSRTLTARDIRTRHGIRVTSPCARSSTSSRALPTPA